MAQTSILDRYQKKFLELVLKEPYVLKHFYWTGGTVLSEHYLHHRESYDIDLFSENEEIHLPSVSKFVSVAGEYLKAQSISHRRYLGLHTFTFKFKDGELKVDFNYYPFPRINIGKNWKGLQLDSLEDIAANKIHTISMKPRSRDFVDLYFLCVKHTFDVRKLRMLAKAKFDWDIDPVRLSQLFLKVGEYTDLPKMLVHFDRKEMDNFFVKLAKSLEREIFK